MRLDNLEYRYFKFANGNIDKFPINHKFFSNKPTHMYTSDVLGFGEWIKI